MACTSEATSGALNYSRLQLGKRARQLQPAMLYFGPDVEHVGNEEGHSCYPMWNAVDTLDGTRDSIGTTFRWEGQNTGNPRGQFYRPRLGPTTNALPVGGWMWTEPRYRIEARVAGRWTTVAEGRTVAAQAYRPYPAGHHHRTAFRLPGSACAVCEHPQFRGL